MWIPDFLLRWIGKDIAGNLKLEDKPMADSPWYTNKSTVAHVVTGLVSIAITVTGVLTADFHLVVPAMLTKVGGIILTLLAGAGIYENQSS